MIAGPMNGLEPVPSIAMIDGHEQVIIRGSFSEVASWRFCGMQHNLLYRNRLVLPSKGGASGLGTRWHEMAAAWFEAQKGLGKTERASVVEVLRDRIPAIFTNPPYFSEEEQKHSEILRWMWDGFLECQDTPSRDYENWSTWTILNTEQEYVLTLPRVPGQPKWLVLQIKVIIDLLGIKAQKYWIIDHKSTSKLVKSSTSEVDMGFEDQAGFYLWAVRELIRLGLLPKGRIGGAIWNYAITAPLKKTERPLGERHWQAYLSRTDKELDLVAIEAAQSLLEAYRRPLAVFPPRHPNKDRCRFLCDVREVCFYSRQAGKQPYIGASEKPDQFPIGLNPELYIDNE